jgi:hypothetical protein
MSPLMRREFPVIWARISTWFATPLVIVVATVYLHDFISKPASEIYGFALAAVGITAALSSICLSTTGPIGRATTLPLLRWAGEHFLHSCLLLIQVLIIAFARDTILAWESVTNYGWLKVAVIALPNTAGLFLGGNAAWVWYWAFDELNKELWVNWRERIEQINSQRTTEKAKAVTDRKD